MTKSRNILPLRRRWTDAELELLRSRYPNESTAAIAADLGREVGCVYQKATQMGIAKSASYFATPAAGRIRPKNGSHPNSVKHQFQKGQMPLNKGLRRPGWAPGRMAETQFKKGRAAHESSNYKPIGTERINADGYLDRKITDDASLFPARRWVGVHRLVWEEANGPIPEGFVVVFRPGRQTADANLITLDAVELVSRAELMKRNTLHRYPQPIPKLIQLRGALNRQINKRIREREDEDHRPA